MPRTAAPGVPLAHYRTHRAGVLLSCRDCHRHEVLDLDAVITRLRQRGLGDEHTGIKAVAAFVRRPCPRCGGRRFESRPAFLDRSGKP